MASNTEANGTSKIVHFLDLDEFGLDQVPEAARTRVKNDVKDFLEEEILRSVASGTSPVQGEGRFRRLDKDYAKENKGGVRISNLELEGDLLSDFFVRNISRGSRIKLGHEGSETPKSDGHNQLSSKAKSWARKTGFPKRRYIPDDSQKFSKRIRDGIESIIDNNIVAPTTDDDVTEFEVDVDITEVNQGTGTGIADEIDVTSSSLFSDESISAFLNNALLRAGRRIR